ncbi:MAG: TfoX/Sxy family protein [Jiangellaceae bacterium]
MRQHGRREAERAGALRPTVAAAMIGLAGELSGTLLDPCCGSGTILAEATAAGWSAAGRDIDPEAVETSRLNAAIAAVDVGDARQLDLRDGSVSVCVSNLPFGRQYDVQGDMDLRPHLARRRTPRRSALRASRLCHDAPVAYDEGLATRIREVLANDPGLAERRMFGGLAMLLDGNMAVGVYGDGLLVRADPAQRESLLARPGAGVFSMGGRPMKGWIVVDADRLTKDDDLRHWVDRGVSFARSLPPK